MLAILYNTSNFTLGWFKKVDLMAYIFRQNFSSLFKCHFSFQLLSKTWLWRIKILSETRKNLQCQTMPSNQKHSIPKIFIFILFNESSDNTRLFGLQKLKLVSYTKKLWKPGDEGFWKIWKRRFFQDIQNSFW